MNWSLQASAIFSHECIVYPCLTAVQAISSICVNWCLWHFIAYISENNVYCVFIVCGLKVSYSAVGLASNCTEWVMCFVQMVIKELLR